MAVCRAVGQLPYVRLLVVVHVALLLAQCGSRAELDDGVPTDGSSLDHAALDAATDAAVESCSGDAAPGLATLASDQSYPQNLVVKPTGVYWTTWAWTDAGSVMSSTVMSLPLGGGTPTPIVAVPGRVQGLAVDATHAYWTEVVSDDGGANSVVMSVPLGGGTPTTIVLGQVDAGNLAVDSTSVYWTTNDGTTGGVMKAPLGGGTPTTLASAPDSVDLIAVDNSNVYWTVEHNGLMMVPLQGGNSKTLDSEVITISGLAVDTVNVYWAVLGSAVNKMPSGGGKITVVASANQLGGSAGEMDNLAVDGLNVYWTDWTSNGDSKPISLYRAPVSGGTPVTVYSFWGALWTLAVDCTSVYWVNGNGNGGVEIQRLSPK